MTTNVDYTLNLQPPLSEEGATGGMVPSIASDPMNPKRQRRDSNRTRQNSQSERQRRESHRQRKESQSDRNGAGKKEKSPNKGGPNSGGKRSRQTSQSEGASKQQQQPPPQQGGKKQGDNKQKQQHQQQGTTPKQKADNKDKASKSKTPSQSDSGQPGKVAAISKPKEAPEKTAESKTADPNKKE